MRGICWSGWECEVKRECSFTGSVPALRALADHWPSTFLGPDVVSSVTEEWFLTTYCIFQAIFLPSSVKHPVQTLEAFCVTLLADNQPVMPTKHSQTTGLSDHKSPKRQFIIVLISGCCMALWNIIIKTNRTSQGKLFYWFPQLKRRKGNCGLMLMEWCLLLFWCPAMHCGIYSIRNSWSPIERAYRYFSQSPWRDSLQEIPMWCSNEN